MKRQTTPWSCLLLVGALTVLTPPVCGAADEAAGVDAKRAEAESLYAQGRYSEALPILEQLDASGDANGPLLYRLTYCQSKTGAPAASEASERRALETLEGELETAPTLEVPFYLSNIYRNTGRIADANRVAAETTERVETGGLPKPETGMDMFQLGKLYADQDRAELATEWYTQAVDALTADGRVGGPYVRWASRYLAEAAYNRKDHDAAQKYYGTLVDEGEGAGPEFERLAISRARVGMYREAADAWRLVESSNPPDPNRARYAGRLCRLAATLKSQSPLAPSGKPWTELTQQELEELMKQEAGRAMQVYTEAQEAAQPTKEERRAYLAKLKEAKAVFVPAALEYTLRGLDIRQTAFFGGYARLILNRSAWRPVWDEADEATN